uniref:NfeD family protein n=1 Tax=Geobacter metallireducens TaxID=28232 RepID=A0A831TWV4_GEOME
MACEWWYWIVFGFVLIGVELLFPSITMVWFGLGALMVGGWSLLWGGDGLLVHVIIWVAVSAACSLGWRRYQRRRSSQGEAGNTVPPPFDGCSSVADCAVLVVSRQGHLLRVVKP